jgi:hypothetical protein
MLNLAEELFLLALNDDKGTVQNSAAWVLPYGIAGAMLADLVLHGKVATAGQKRVAVLDSAATGDAVLDAALAEIVASKRPRKATAWVEALSRKRFWRGVPESLVARGVLREEEKRWLWVIPYAAYPQQDASAKYWIKQALRAVVLAGQEPDPRQLALLSLVQVCRMVPLLLTKDERKPAAQRIETLVADEPIGPAVARAIAEVEGAAVSSTAAVLAATCYS